MSTQTGGGRFYRDWGKRWLDVLVASAVLLLLCPVILPLALLVRWQHGSPVFFRQRRPGKDSRPFVMYKFRTMREAFDDDGKPLPDEQRLTAFGQWMRSTSLDELPEFINVLKGDMSLVGPRPLLMQYLERYTPEQARRHEARPGITGWAQVNGRNAVSWRQKFEYDVWYVDNVSPSLDLKILMRTVSLVFGRHGISQPGSATAEEFRGEPDE